MQLAGFRSRRGSTRRRAGLAAGLVVAALVGLAPVAKADPVPDPGPSVPDPSALAAESGQPVPVPAATSKTTAVVANPDGTFTATIAAGPVREPDPGDPSGWTPLDLSLVDTGDALAPAVGDAGVMFSKGGAGAAATLATGDGSSYAVGWNGVLPAPVVSGASATYADVVGDADLVLAARPDGYGMSLVVPSRPAAPLVVEMPLSLQGLTATVAEDDQLRLTGPSGELVAAADPAVMTGAAIDPVTGEPGETESVPISIVSTLNGPLLRIAPDPAFFDRPGLPIR